MPEVTVQRADAPILSVTVTMSAAEANLVRALLGALANAGPFEQDDVDSGYDLFSALDAVLDAPDHFGTEVFGPINPKPNWEGA